MAGSRESGFVIITDRIAKLCLTALCTIPGTFERSGGLGPDGQIPIEVAAVTFRLTA